MNTPIVMAESAQLNTGLKKRKGSEPQIGSQLGKFP